MAHVAAEGKRRGRLTFRRPVANPRRLRRVAVSAQVLTVLFLIGVLIAGVTVATTPRSGIGPAAGPNVALVGEDTHPHLLIGILVAMIGLVVGVTLLVVAVRAERRADTAERAALAG